MPVTDLYLKISVEELERILTESPHDESRWQQYNSALVEIGSSDLSETRWLIYQYLSCLRSNLTEPIPLNELSGYYDQNRQRFNALLCSLASLAADPTQTSLYENVKSAYADGLLTPLAYVPQEPVQCMVSVILATYNRPTLLRHAIRSVLDQTLQDFELLVINDGGSESAKEVADSFASSKIRYFTKESRGHRSAMNWGLKNARGRYIAYLDDDDIYFPNHLETVVSAAEANGLNFVCSRNRWVIGRWEEDRWIETEDLTRQEPFRLERLYVSAVIADLTVLHTRSLAERVGLFWEEPPRGGEWEYWVRCSRYADIVRLEPITAEVRVPGKIPSNQPARAVFFTELWRRYFGSGFGHAILATAAWHNRDIATFRQHLESLQDSYQFLSGRMLKFLWDIGIVDGDSGSGRRLLSHITNADPVWVGQRLLGHARFYMTPSLYRRLFPIYCRLGLYVLRNPSLMARHLWGKVV